MWEAYNISILSTVCIIDNTIFFDWLDIDIKDQILAKTKKMRHVSFLFKQIIGV